MKEIDRAIEWALATAADSRYGYDQGKRWGPDYDCSSFVISAFEFAGVPVKTGGATYTGNMRSVFLRCGFRDVTDSVNRANGAGLERGDVLLNEVHHTALYLGQGQLVEAAGNELGGIRGGVSGDQTGREIGIRGYYSYPWDCVLRCGAAVIADAGGQSGEGYTVAAGDSLWAIAERKLGDGRRYADIMDANGLTGTVIYPGMRLVIPGTAGGTAAPIPAETVSVLLPMLQRGSTGAGIGALRTLLRYRGAALTETGETFGTETETAVRKFQTEQGLETDGIVGPETWKTLVF